MTTASGASMVTAKTTLLLWMSCLLSSKATYKLEADNFAKSGRKELDLNQL